jgi:mRNA interferase RelE/StbE
MAAYRVFFKEFMKKNLHGLAKKDLRKIHHRIRMLSDDPPPSGHEKLTGQER